MMKALTRGVFLLATALAVQGSWAAGTCCLTPDARNDSAAAYFGVPRIIDVLANDSDADGEPITVSFVGNACPGTATSQGDGTILYSPPASGDDTTCEIDYTIIDSGNRSAGAVVTVSLTERPTGGPSDPGAAIGLDLEREDPRRLVYEGEPIFLAGYYPGLMPFTLKERIDSDYPQEFLDRASTLGLNLLRTVMSPSQAIEGRPNDTPDSFIRIHPYKRSGACCTYHSGQLGPNLMRKRFNLNQFDPSFFAYWNSILEYAYEKGIIMELTFFEASHTKNEENHIPFPTHTPGGLRYSYYKAENNNNGVDISSDPDDADWYDRPEVVQRQIELVGHTVEQLCHHPNLIWETANEAIKEHADKVRDFHPFNGKDWHDVLYDEVRAAEERAGCEPHLVMPIDLDEHRDVPGHKIPGKAANNTNAKFRALRTEFVDRFVVEDKPLISDNDCCVVPGPVERRRRKAWTTLVSGGYPLLFHFEADLPAGMMDGLDEAMEQVGLVRKFLLAREIDVFGMEPADQLVSNASEGMVWPLARRDEDDPGPDADPNYSELIVYFFKGGEATLAGLPESYSAEWFGTTTGTFADADPGPTFSKPAGDDWVLYIKRNGLGSDLPVISVQPVPASVSVGQAATFSLVAAAPSGAPLSYEWQKAGFPLTDGGAFSGTTTASLRIDPVQPGETGIYRCVVTNLDSFEFVISNEVALSILGGEGLEIQDSFSLNAIDRVAGAPLNGTTTEVGARTWRADEGVTLTADGEVSGAVAGPPVRQAFVDFDALAFADETLSVEAQVDPRDSRWTAIGFASAANLPMTQAGALWMLVRPGGQVEVLAAGVSHHLVTQVVALDPGYTPIRLFVDPATRTVTAQVGDHLILADVPLPDDLDLTISHVGFELNLQDVPPPDRVRLDDFAVRVGAPQPVGQAPFGGSPASLPARIEAEEYDEGGQGVAYHDTTPGNQAASPFRVDEWVDAGGTAPVAVAAAETGEWLEYTVVAGAGPYELRIRHANDDSSCQLSVAGAAFGAAYTGDAGAGRFTPSADGGWTEQAVGYVVFAEGETVFRLVFEGDCGPIDWFELDPELTSGQVPFLASGPAPVPGRIEAENFDAVLAGNGQGISYLDRDPTNVIGDYRDEGPDLHTLTVPGDGERTVLEHTFVGEWLEYTVDIAAGSYDVAVHYRSDGSEQDETVTVSLEDTSVSFDVDLPSVGFGAGSWSEPTYGLARNVQLPGGEHVLRLTLHGSHADIDWIELAPHEVVPLTAVDDVIIPTVFDPQNAAYTIPVTSLVGNDVTDGPGVPEVVSVDLWGLRGNARLSADGTSVRFHVSSSSFWSERLGWFDYTIRDATQPFYTATARAFLVPEGPLAEDDAAITGLGDCNVEIPLSQLLEDDLPQGKISVSQAPHPNVTQLADGLLWSGCFQPGTYQTFDYEIVLDQNPSARSTATVYVFRDNPVVAADDTFLVPWLQSTAFGIPFVDLLANDEPSGQLGTQLQVVEDPFPVLVPASSGELEPDIGAFRFRANLAQFFDVANASASFDYTAILSNQSELTDTGTVHLLPQASTRSDVLMVPFDPTLDVVMIPNTSVLANDEPVGRIHIVGADNDGEDKPARDDAVLEFHPSEDFWSSRTATFSYEIYLDQHEERVTPGEVTLIAANGAEPSPDVFAVPTELADGFFFIQSGNQSAQQPPHVLENDEPAGLVRVRPPGLIQQSHCGRAVPSSTHNNFHGWQFYPEAAFYNDSSCSPTSFTYTLEFLASFTIPTPNAEATGTVYLFPGAAPPLVAVGEDVVTYVDVPLSITRDALLDNDQAVTPELVELTQPSNGRLVETPGTVEYHPVAGYTGPDSFTYRIRDAYGRLSDPATVRIDVQASPVVAREDAFLLPAGVADWRIWALELEGNDLPADRTEVEEVGKPAFGTLTPAAEESWIYRPSADFWAVGSDRFDYSIAWLDHPQLTAVGEVLIEALPDCGLSLASDDFETDLGHWDGVTANGGTVSITPDAAMSGAGGLEIQIDPRATSVSVQKAFAEAETHARAGFFFDPNTLRMTEGSRHAILTSGQAGGGLTLQLELLYQHGGFHLLVATRIDNGRWRSEIAELADAPQRVDLEWRAASGPETADGVTRLWLDGLRVVNLEGLDNDGRRLSGLGLGAVFGLDDRTSGSLYYDGVEVCRGEAARVPFASDDFESGALDAWDEVVASGGLLYPAPLAALEGDLGLYVGIGDGGPLTVVDRSPAAVASYRADFLFSADDLALQTGKTLTLLVGSSTTGAVIQLKLRATDYGRELFAQAKTDSGWATSELLTLPYGGQRIHLAWRAASSPSAADGALTLLVGETLAATLSGLDNPAARVDTVRLGLPFGSPPGVGGGFYIDDFRSWH